MTSFFLSLIYFKYLVKRGAGGKLGCFCHQDVLFPCMQTFCGAQEQGEAVV